MGSEGKRREAKGSEGTRREGKGNLREGRGEDMKSQFTTNPNRPSQRVFILRASGFIKWDLPAEGENKKTFVSSCVNIRLLRRQICNTAMPIFDAKIFC